MTKVEITDHRSMERTQQVSCSNKYNFFSKHATLISALHVEVRKHLPASHFNFVTDHDSLVMKVESSLENARNCQENLQRTGIVCDLEYSNEKLIGLRLKLTPRLVEFLEAVKHEGPKLAPCST